MSLFAVLQRQGCHSTGMSRTKFRKPRAYLGIRSAIWKIHLDKNHRTGKKGHRRALILWRYFSMPTWRGDLRIDPDVQLPDALGSARHTAAVLLSALSLPRAPAINHAVAGVGRVFPARGKKTAAQKKNRPSPRPGGEKNLEKKKTLGAYCFFFCSPNPKKGGPRGGAPILRGGGPRLIFVFWVIY